MRRLILATLLAAASAPALACFIVYDGADRVLYRGQRAPVDLRAPLHETVPQRFPGGHLVFDAGSDCAQLDLSSAARSSAASRAPLLSQRGVTAGAGDSIRPGVSVLPSPFARADEDTRRMGGPPARPRTAAEILRMPVLEGAQTVEPGVR